MEVEYVRVMQRQNCDSQWNICGEDYSLYEDLFHLSTTINLTGNCGQANQIPLFADNSEEFKGHTKVAYYGAHKSIEITNFEVKHGTSVRFEINSDCHYNNYPELFKTSEFTNYQANDLNEETRACVFNESIIRYDIYSFQGQLLISDNVFDTERIKEILGSGFFALIITTSSGKICTEKFYLY
jgi:hypothetical protein